jgi:GNAT superfamily N-acetyltransferase
MRIREFTAADYRSVVDIQNAIFPDTPAVVADYVDGDERRDPKCRYRRWVAVKDGRVVGVAQYDQKIWAYHPQKFAIMVRVRPEAQGRGIGSALYGTLRAALEPHDPIKLTARGREDRPRGLRFLESRGFQERYRDAVSHLDVAAFDPTPYAGLEERLRATGIAVKTLRELEGDPDRDRKLYDLDWDVSRDIPGAEETTRVPFEKWVEDVLRNPQALPDGFFVAVHGDAYVGMSNLWADRASDMLYQGLTGVRRAYRRRGVATAMKVRGILFAWANGNPLIKTDNEVTNRPMLSINHRLGFVPQPAWISFEKELEEE